jgi:hypothetical protein
MIFVDEVSTHEIIYNISQAKISHDNKKELLI